MRKYTFAWLQKKAPFTGVTWGGLLFAGTVIVLSLHIYSEYVRPI